MEFVWFILVGLVAGWLAGVLVKGGGFGVIGDIIVGILGALLGGFLFRSLVSPLAEACLEALLLPLSEQSFLSSFSGSSNEFEWLTRRSKERADKRQAPELGRSL